MRTCAKCGHALGVGRFCVNCGHPVSDVPTDGPAMGDTAERPAVLGPGAPTVTGPAAPPPPTPPPPEPRFPLYADEVRPGAPPTYPPAYSPPPSPPSSSHRGAGTPSWLPWLVVVVVLLLVGTVGTALLLTGGDDDEPATDAPSSSAPPSASDSPTEPSTPTPTPTPSVTSTEPGEPTDVAGTANASVPRTAPPNTDVNGNLVRYEARNMLDGVPTTCWRMPGDGSGSTITVTLAEPTTLSEVGIVNGYAKTSDDGGSIFDWYRGNRRVLAVEWSFDDGTVVSQSLQEVRRLQTVDVGEVTTSTVTLRLVTVSAPGTGR
ncbi:MAG: discoidin domain-containing protein, partial [Nocardioides sp.]|nr:discoidin domain-containing protein [Nocardioides sp.]